MYTYKRWPKGTWMKLRTAEILRAFVGPGPEKKMSARRLARYAEVHPSFIDHLLAGRRRSCEPKTANRIAEALELPVEVLFEVHATTTKQKTAKSRAESAA